MNERFVRRGKEPLPEALEELDFDPVCDFFNIKVDPPLACTNKAYFSCRIPHARVHNPDRGVSLICMECAHHAVKLMRFPTKCPGCDYIFHKVSEYICDIRRLN